jgi:hypothetical protein
MRAIRAGEKIGGRTCGDADCPGLCRKRTLQRPLHLDAAPDLQQLRTQVVWIESGAGASVVKIFIAFEQEMLRGAACPQGACLPLLNGIYDDSHPKAALANEFFRH